MQERVIVIGAGVVGSASALQLAAAGYDVEIIDPDEPASGASFGNASFLGSTECVPMASPGVMQNVPGWILSQKGPLFLQPSFLPRLIPWLLRFAANSSRARTEGNTAALAKLLRTAKADSLEWLASVGLPSHLSETDNLRLYPEKAQFAADQYKLGLRRHHGAEYQQLDSGEIADLEPSIKGRYEVGLLAKGAHYFKDPVLPVLKSIARLHDRGGRFRRDAVVGLGVGGDNMVTLHMASGERVDADHVVIAAGIDSAKLARTVGDTFPLISERGYHLQYESHDINLSRGVIDTARGMAATPLSGGLRVAGMVELADREKPPTAQCIRALKIGAASMFGEGFGKGVEVETWLGHRPSLPDGLPVIGSSKTHPRIIYNFGHGHLGLTLAATSARLVVDHMNGLDSDNALAGVSPQRF